MTHDHPEATEAEKGYDRLSRWYQSLERMLFGSALTRARYQLLDRLPQADRLLVFGDGDGRLTREISRRRPDCSMVSVDLSSEMLRLQRQRLSGGRGHGSIELIHADVRSINLDPKDFDGIVLVFFLDCFRRAELEDLLPLWLATVKSGGFVYFVDFIMPEAGWRAVRGWFMLSLMHCFFRWQTGLENRRLVDFTELFKTLRLECMVEHVSNHGLIRSAIYRVS